MKPETEKPTESKTDNKDKVTEQAPGVDTNQPPLKEISKVPYLSVDGTKQGENQARVAKALELVNQCLSVSTGNGKLNKDLGEVRRILSGMDLS